MVTLTVVDAAENSDVSVINITVKAEPVFPIWVHLVIGTVILVLVAVVYRLKFM